MPYDAGSTGISDEIPVVIAQFHDDQFRLEHYVGIRAGVLPFLGVDVLVSDAEQDVGGSSSRVTVPPEVVPKVVP